MIPPAKLSLPEQETPASIAEFARTMMRTRFMSEHIIAKKHGGATAVDNLAYACQHCNLHKGPNLSGIDPQSGEVTTLYHPRRDTWNLHFAMEEFHIIGVTPTGRASVRVLAMNDSDRVQLRQLTGISGQS